MKRRKHEPDPPNVFVFCEKSTGEARFHAESNSDPNNIIERMANLLAVQCLVRGSDPNDFAILVPAATTLGNRLVSRAKELLRQGREAAGPSTLSPRQKEILQSVMCNLANKEIASKLNIAVRTVKFHISSLFTKFGVGNRAELARRAAGPLRVDNPESEAINLERRRSLEDFRVWSDRGEHGASGNGQGAQRSLRGPGPEHLARLSHEE